MSKKLRIAILFGGKSAEHEVSLRSARNVAAALDRSKYDVTLIGIDTTGAWLPPSVSQRYMAISSGRGSIESDTHSVALAPASGGDLSGSEHDHIDVVFPVLHGPFGEDGTVQGLLKLADVPFVGPDVLGSAVGMDKDVAKRLLRDAKILVTPFLVAATTKTITFENAKQKLGLPLFIKPANLGSSVGVNKVRTKKEFVEALANAFKYDTKVLIEKFIRGREIECAVLGNEKPEASVLGEIIPHHEFYSYEAKYLDENGASLQIPAKLPKQVSKKAQELAVKTFKVLCCEGMARVDFFVTPRGKTYVNEINTIPGFTNISMYPKLWEASGLSYAKLIDRLIELAIERHQRQQQLKSFH